MAATSPTRMQTGSRFGKSCINITLPDQLDHEAIKDPAKETAGQFAGQYLTQQNP